MGACLFDQVTPAMRIYKEEIVRSAPSIVRAHDYEQEGWCSPIIT